MLHLYCSALTGTTGSTTLDGCSASLWIVSTPASCCAQSGINDSGKARTAAEHTAAAHSVAAED